MRVHALCVEESSDAESVIESGFKMIGKLHFHVSLAGLYASLWHSSSVLAHYIYTSMSDI